MGPFMRCERNYLHHTEAEMQSSKVDRPRMVIQPKYYVPWDALINTSQHGPVPSKALLSKAIVQIGGNESPLVTFLKIPTACPQDFICEQKPQSGDQKQTFVQFSGPTLLKWFTMTDVSQHFPKNEV